MSPPVGSARAGVVGASTGAAIPDSVVDQFEDGDVAEYTTANTSAWEAQTGTVYDGTYAGRMQGSGGGESNTLSLPGDGLAFYPQAGGSNIPFGEWVRYTVNGGNFNWVALDFAAQSTGQNANRYSVVYDDNASELQVRKDGNTGTVLKSATLSIGQDTWFALVVDTWDGSGNIVAKAYGANGDVLQSVSVTDTSYTSGGVGFSVGAGSTPEVFFDA